MYPAGVLVHTRYRYEGLGLLVHVRVALSSQHTTPVRVQLYSKPAIENSATQPGSSQPASQPAASQEPQRVTARKACTDVDVRKCEASAQRQCTAGDISQNCTRTEIFSPPQARGWSGIGVGAAQTGHQTWDVTTQSEQRGIHPREWLCASPGGGRSRTARADPAL